MKRIALTLLVLVGFTLGATAQDNENSVKYDGMYIAQIGGEGTSTIIPYKLFMCVRFMEDGKMYAHSMGTYAPEKVAAWFGPQRFEWSGTPKIVDSTIEVVTNNQGSNNLAVEGPMNLIFKGKILTPELLSLEMEYEDGQKEVFDFKFVEVEKWIKVVK